MWWPTGGPVPQGRLLRRPQGPDASSSQQRPQSAVGGEWIGRHAGGRASEPAGHWVCWLD